jgi:hypothetical protein
VDLWQALACLGMAGLILDWVYFGRMRRTAIRSAPGEGPAESFPALLLRRIRLAGGRRRA